MKSKPSLPYRMLNGDDLIGAFIVSRKEVRPFTDKQIGLVHNFAAQQLLPSRTRQVLKELRDRTTEVERLNKQLEHRVTDQVDEIERMSRLRRFLPPQVADLIVASGSEKQLESHRREITALFCDLRGFTGFSESADPEDVMALLRDYHAAIGEIVIKYGGTLERYAGDGVMVVFNDPVPVENPALQAGSMALELRDGLGSFDGNLEPPRARDWLWHRHSARVRDARHDRLRMITGLRIGGGGVGVFLTTHMGRRFGATHAIFIALISSAARLALECIGNSDVFITTLNTPC